MNYYQIFKIAETPLVDQSVLSAKYIGLQRAFHPDFYVGATESEKEEALEMSAAVNKAYKIFRNELLSIAYFLEIKGCLIDGEKYELPGSFLMEMMDINELLDEGVKAGVEEQIAAIEAELYVEVKDWMMMEKENWEVELLQKIKAYYFKKKYLNRILDRLHD
jgi:molecular chaperone HscB